MHVKSPPCFVIEGSEFRDGFHGCEVHLGGVLYGDDTIMATASHDNLVPVWPDQFPRVELAVIEKAAGGNDLAPSSAGGRDAFCRGFCERSGQLLQALRPPRISEAGIVKFGCNFVRQIGESRWWG